VGEGKPMAVMMQGIDGDRALKKRLGEC